MSKDGDTMQRCDDCGHLRNVVCSLAYPGHPHVSARKGYEPQREFPHNCIGFRMRGPGVEVIGVGRGIRFDP